MGKHKRELVPREIDLPIFPNVILLDDYRPPPPSRAARARMRIDESIAASKKIANTMDDLPRIKSTRKIIEEMNLWPGAEPLSDIDRERLLQEVSDEESGLPAVWKLEALRQLGDIASDGFGREASDGQA